MINIKQTLKIIMIILILGSLGLLAILFIIPPEVLRSGSDSDNVAVTPPQIDETEKSIEDIPKKEIAVASNSLSNMFYRSYKKQEIEEVEVIEQHAVTHYDESRFSYLGTASTDNQKQKYLLKDNQLDFIFPIEEGSTTHELTITELNLPELYIILSDGEKLYRIRIK